MGDWMLVAHAMSGYMGQSQTTSAVYGNLGTGTDSATWDHKVWFVTSVPVPVLRGLPWFRATSPTFSSVFLFWYRTLVFLHPRRLAYCFPSFEKKSTTGIYFAIPRLF